MIPKISAVRIRGTSEVSVRQGSPQRARQPASRRVQRRPARLVRIRRASRRIVRENRGTLRPAIPGQGTQGRSLPPRPARQAQSRRGARQGPRVALLPVHQAGQGILTDGQWEAIVRDYLKRMSILPDDGAAGVTWLAVRHGLSRNGNDHVHVMVQLATDDGGSTRSTT